MQVSPFFVLRNVRFTWERQPPSPLCIRRATQLLFNPNYTPSLRYCAPFLANSSISSTGDHHLKNEVHEAGSQGSSSLGNPADYSPDSRHGDATTGDAGSTSSHKLAAPNPPPLSTPTATAKLPPNAQELLDTAAHDPGSKEAGIRNSNTQLPCHRRIKVGFLSAFFFHHSVGLLVEGVVTRLDRRRFETTAILLQPHPTAASTASPGKGGGDGERAEGDGGSVGDDVYNAVRMGTEHVLDVPMNRCERCRA